MKMDRHPKFVGEAGCRSLMIFVRDHNSGDWPPAFQV
ncbi:MAG: hypothetical protein QOD80_10, partial [Verrucomicrobiota bacterium]